MGDTEAAGEAAVVGVTGCSAAGDGAGAAGAAVRGCFGAVPGAGGGAGAIWSTPGSFTDGSVGPEPTEATPGTVGPSAAHATPPGAQSAQAKIKTGAILRCLN